MKFLIVVACLIAVSYASVNPDWRIVGGDTANEGQFPYQVSLRRNGGHSCGGSILNEHWILTAAHCLYNVYGPLTVKAGSNSLSTGGDVYKTTRTIYHEGYDPYMIKNDIGLVKVASAIQFNAKVQPIPLNTEAIGVGVRLILSGWGTTSYPGSVPDKLQFIKLLSLDNVICKERMQGLEIYDNQLCTFTQLGEGACHGDSGGPLAYNGKVAGIVSWGRPCAIGFPDVFTRVSEFTTWIEDTMSKN